VIENHVNSISSHTAIPRALLDAPGNVFEKNYRLQDIQLSKNRLRARALRRGHARALRSRPKLVVENTGLEPVTSWLQTRRSPS
jgi:hypothetical protein